MQPFHEPSANSDRIMRLKRQVQKYERGLCIVIPGIINKFWRIAIALSPSRWITAMVSGYIDRLEKKEMAGVHDMGTDPLIACTRLIHSDSSSKII